MDIKDIAGLSQPLTKLIEVISSGIGHLASPYLKKRDADTRAYEFDKMIQSLTNRNLLSSDTELEYSDKDGLKIKTKNSELSNYSNNEIDIPMLSRYDARAAYQNAKRQQNLEKIIQITADQLIDKQQVSDVKLDEDWTAHFFVEAENISTEEMQNLWGKVLAGEISSPKSFSLRTLDVLKNLTKEDAQIIERILKYSVNGGYGKFFILRDILVPKEKIGTIPSELALLRELGILSDSDMGWDLSYKLVASETEVITFVHGKKILFIRRHLGAPLRSLPIFHITRIGRELTNLIDITDDLNYLKQVAHYFGHDNTDFEIGDVVGYEGENIRYKDSLPLVI